ncbi:hypothetical protein ES703_91263 [subsurface metagenome]
MGQKEQSKADHSMGFQKGVQDFGTSGRLIMEVLLVGLQKII